MKFRPVYDVVDSLTHVNFIRFKGCVFEGLITSSSLEVVVPESG